MNAFIILYTKDNLIPMIFVMIFVKYFYKKGHGVNQTRLN